MNPSYRYRPSLANRLTAAGLSLAVIALFVLLLLSMGLLVPGGGGPGQRLTSMTFGETPEKTEQKTKAKTKAPEVERTVEQRVVPPVVPPVPAEKLPPLNLIRLSRTEMAAADIARMPQSPAQSSAPASQSGGGGGSAGPGEGPGGAKLYNAEWYREPTRAEMITYMPQRPISGAAWAMIACKTQDQYRVDDCQELGESPPGSGLSRALRQAAWQFLVRPPRIDGKPQIGAWVRIRFDFNKVATKPEPPLESGGD